MRIAVKLHHRLLPAALLAVLLVSAPAPAHAASKEIIELQTQVQQLMDMVQRLQSTLDGRFGVLQHLLEQEADNSNQLSAAVTALQQKLGTQSDGTNGKLDAVSGQVQSLNDSIDELKTRVAALNKSIQDMQSQLQNIQSPPQTGMPQSGSQPGSPSNLPSGETAPQQPNGGGSPSYLPGLGPSGSQAAPQGGAPASPLGGVPGAAQPAPPLQETFESGMRDYNAARYSVATSEFQEVLQYYPLDDLAGVAQFYLGEIAYHQGHYADAVAAYNAVLEGFAGSSKAAAAQLHKGFALLKMDKRADGIHELRLLIERHPQTPEANEARSRLASMGIHSAR